MSAFRRLLFCLLCLVPFAGSSAIAGDPCPLPPGIAVDGYLVPEIQGSLDANLNQVRDILESLARSGVVALQVDNIGDGGFQTGSDGFRDAGLRCPNLANPGLCPAGVQCFDIEFGGESVRSGLNSGKLTVIYLPDTDGFIDPANRELTDDSVLYVGIDIFNGFPFPPNNIVGDPATPIGFEGLTWWRHDFTDTFPAGDICEDGVADFNGDGVPDFVGVPFDVDSDGLTRDVTRWDGLPPGCERGIGQCNGQKGIPPSDTDLEFYRLELFTCTTPGLLSSGRITAAIQIQADALGNVELVFPTPGIPTFPESWIRTFPLDGSLDTDLDHTPGDPARDVEFAICHVDSVVDQFYPGQTYETVDRFRIARGGVRTRSDTDGDSAGEDAIRLNWQLRIPQIEVEKEVHCVTPFGAGSTNPFGPSVEALAGAELEYRITVENTGNVPLAVTLQDVLGLSPEYLNDPTVIDPATPPIVTLARPASPAQNGPVNAGNAESKNPPFNPEFFQPGVGFKAALQSGDPVCLGVLNGVNFDPNCGFIPGDTVTVVFRARVPGDPNLCPSFCEDFTNAITATGDPDVVRADRCDPNSAIVSPCPDSAPPFTCPSGSVSLGQIAGNEVTDNPNVIDTPFELSQTPPADNNVVEIDVLCREVDLLKEVRQFSPTVSPYVSGDTGLTLPTDPASFPLVIEYRYTVTNNGDVPESISVTDPDFCADVLGTPGVTFVNINNPAQFAKDAALCTVCNGTAVALLAPGQTTPVPFVCRVRFESPAALSAFLLADDNNPNCPIIPPPLPIQDSTCYQNCARVTATAQPGPDVCVPPPVICEDYAFATICGCRLDVTKKVECLDCPNIVDPNNPQSTNPVTPLPVTPGSCLRYTVTITNPNSDPVCGIQLIDTFDFGGNGAACVTLEPNSLVATIGNINVTNCFVGGSNAYKIDGTPIIYAPTNAACDVGGANPNDPNNSLLNSGETMTLTYRVKVNSVSNPVDPNLFLCDPLNTVVASGAIGNNPAACSNNYACSGEDSAAIDIIRPSVACAKEWAVRWDQNANCVLDPNEVFGPFTNNLDLCTVIFPIELRLRVTATNTGETPLSVSAADAALLACVNLPADGVQFVGLNEFSPPVNKVIPATNPDSTATFEATVRIDSADAARAWVKACSGNPNATSYTNTVTVTGTVAGTTICPGDPVTSVCSATITPPPPCDITVIKEVACLSPGDDGSGPAGDGPHSDPTPGGSASGKFLAGGTTFQNVMGDKSPEPGELETESGFVGSNGTTGFTPIDDLADAAGGPADAPTFFKSVQALPGARLRYRIRVTNNSTCQKLPQLCITDVLGCPTWFTADPNLVNSIKADINGLDVTNCVKPSFNVTGAEFCVKFAGACSGNSTTPWLAPGQTLTILFDVKVPADYVPPAICSPGSPPDCRNTVTVEAYSEACTPPTAACDVDTSFADVDVQLPRLDCRTQICLLEDPTDPNSIIVCSDPNDPNNLLEVDCDRQNYPLYLKFSYTLTNTGEVPLTNARVCDTLLTKIQSIGGTINTCNLASPDPLDPNLDCANLGDLGACGAPNSSKTAFCIITVPSWSAWRQLVPGATGQPICLTTDVRGSATVVVGDLCADGAAGTVTTDDCDATVCIEPPCQIEVQKTARCLTKCVNGVPKFKPGDPQQGYTDNLEVAPGAAVEFKIEISNIGSGNLADLLYAIKLTDSLTSVPAGLINYQAGSAKVRVVNAAGATICQPTIAGFNVAGNPVTLTFNQPPCNTPIQKDWKVIITFVGCIPANAPEGTITNNADVSGSPFPGNPKVYCCDDDDTTTVLVRRPEYVCTSKEWSIQWDGNANCLVDAGDPTLPLNDLHDLCVPGDPNSHIIFPARLCVTFTVTNSGPIDLLVTMKDPNLVAAVNSVNAAFNPDPISFQAGCEIFPVATTKPVAKNGGVATWTCCILVNSAEAFRALALADENIDLSVADADAFENQAKPEAKMDPNDLVVCVPPLNEQSFIAPLDNDCYARIIPPPPCEFDVVKTVVCVDPNDPNLTIGDPLNPANDTLVTVPGSVARFTILITNTSDCVKLPRLRIDDDFTRKDWIIDGTFRAKIGADDLAICVGGPFGDVVKTGVAQCVTFSCRPATPWLAPGETLVLSFDVKVPDGFNQLNSSVDALNKVTVDGFTEVCLPPNSANSPCQPPLPYDVPCLTRTDEADINVLVPGLVCSKTLEVDFDNNGSIDLKDSLGKLSVTSASFPLRLIYTMTATNEGELPLKDVTICDSKLVSDALAAGGTILSCDLCDAVCDGTGDDCAEIGAIAVGNSVEVTCELLFDSAGEFEDFVESGPSTKLCYDNTATVNGVPDIDPNQVCAPGDLEPVAPSTCTVQLCAEPAILCPPVTKARFEIWNENEVKFGPTERCIGSWDCRKLSEYTFDTGIPNFFLKVNLQTDRARARVDGIESSVVCGPDSIKAPLLGVSAKHFKLGATNDKAGSELAGTGTEAGQIRAPNAGPIGPPEESDTPPRASTSQKGSLLVFPKVTIKWSGGQIVQDTYLSLSNNSNQDVKVRLLFAKGNDPNGLCTAVPITISLTKNQPKYWSAGTGIPAGIPPFGIVDPQLDPNNDTLEGYVMMWAVDNSNREINWNHLTGTATIVNRAERSAWEYKPWAFQTELKEQGQPLLEPYGTLDLNGSEYEYCPNQLLIEFFPPLDGLTPTVAGICDTELTLMVMIQNYSDQNIPK